MQHDKNIEEQVDRLISQWRGMGKKKMFGGICYLLNGNMCFGIHKDYLIVRTGKEKAEEKLKLKHTKPFDITGKAMKGWVMVEGAGCKKDEDMKAWIELGRSFAKTLPQK